MDDTYRYSKLCRRQYTICYCGRYRYSLKLSKASLENASNTLFKLCRDDLFKGIIDKCPLLVKVKDKVSMKIGDFNIVNSECEKLLGVKFDYRLTFNNHVSDLCKNTSPNINALARVAPCMSILKRHICDVAFLL